MAFIVQSSKCFSKPPLTVVQTQYDAIITSRAIQIMQQQRDMNMQNRCLKTESAEKAAEFMLLTKSIEHSMQAAL